MPDKSGRLNGLEKAFVDVYARTGDATYAAERAGYSSPQPRGAQNLAKPAINAAIVAAQQAILFNELLPEAISQLRGLLTNTATPAGARVQAVKLVLDRTLDSGDAGSRKELHEMTLEELERRRQELMSERANMAKTIEPEPGDSAQPAPKSEPEPSVFG